MLRTGLGWVRQLVTTKALRNLGRCYTGRSALEAGRWQWSQGVRHTKGPNLMAIASF
jgi:hypothetical protein